MKIIFFFYLILSTLSVIGFGFFLNNFLNLKNESSNLGLIGIFGLFLLSLISSFTHLFLSHSYTHNIIVLLVGICLFIFFIQKKKFDLKFIFTCFILLLSGFLIAKNNEDFPYYHLPNSLQFVEQKIQFGLGNLNHGFKHSSSIFLLNSIFYFPKTIYYLFNIPNFLFLVFSVYYFLSKIFEKKTKFINFSKIFCIFSGLILLTKFSRLAEYGTDIAGQILILIVILIASNMLIKKDISFENEKNEYLTILILIVFSISMKVYFMIYLVIPTYIFFKVRAKKKILRLIFDYKNFLILTTPIFFVIFFNFSATGCLVYPVSLTCFPDIFDWSLSINTVETLNSHYELWAKAGRGPNFEVDNTKEYLTGFLWIQNWFNNYFLTKVSDYLLVIFTLMIVFLLFFYNKKYRNKIKAKYSNKNFYNFYLLIIGIFLLWFFKFPQLRYGGYVLIFLLIIMPFSFYFSEIINFKSKNVKKKIFYLFAIGFFVFNIKNIKRISNEFDSVYLDNFKNFPLFYVKNVPYEEKKIDNYTINYVDGMCWATPSPCLRSLSFKINENKGYKFYSLK